MSYAPVPFVPTQASSEASRLDNLFLVELAIGAFFTFLIFLFIVYFCLRYRRRGDHEIPPRVGKHYWLEIAWTVIPFLIMVGYFLRGAELYVNIKRPIDNGIEVRVIGKQWMWKIAHEGGVREINALHVPVGRRVKLILSSQDVIHDFFIPEFRIKQDVLPGSFVTEWFEATKVGEYHIFCSQYCGTDHAMMVGKVFVMSPSDYQAWLAGAGPTAPSAAVGAQLFQHYACGNCHGQRAPTLAGLYNSTVTLQDGSTVIADESYLRESIQNPAAKIVQGYPPIMPAYYDLTEEQVDDLVEYIKSLEVVRNVGPAATQPLDAPATRPAVGDQPSVIPNFPPAERHLELPLRQEAGSKP